MFTLVTQVLSSEYKVTFGAMSGDLVDGMPGLEAFAGLSQEELDELYRATGFRLSLRRGSLGYGESSSGIELVIAIASIPADIVGLVAAGMAVKSLVEKIRRHRARTVAITDPQTMAAVAAASVEGELLDVLTGARFVSARNLLGGEPPYHGGIWGTDARHVWAVTFQHSVDGYVVIIFMSPTGLVLGHARVPLEAYFDGTTYHRRTQEDLPRHQTSE